MSAFHRIKALGLIAASEARLLKNLARSLQRDLNKQKNNTRCEARSIHLARGFLKGVPYSAIECPLRPKDKGHVSATGYTRTHPNWERVHELAEMYGKKLYGSAQELAQDFAEWRDAALPSSTWR